MKEAKMGMSGGHVSSKAINYGMTNQEVTQFFMEYGKLHTYPKNLTLYSSGEPGDQVFYINHGEIRISRSTNDGKEITLDILRQGSVFGEVESFQASERRNTAMVKKDSIVHCVSRELLMDRVKSDPKLAYWLIDVVSKKQLKTENLLENLLFKSANAKVANLLLDLANAYGSNDTDGILIDYPITHQEIGNIIATTRETVSYAFMEFRQLGLIGTVKRKTVILDQEGLQSIAAE
ncbi:MAG: CRP-like cAMP-binding protein [bacterium]|jgi:CRP-like cAMP-binding protein